MTRFLDPSVAFRIHRLQRLLRRHFLRASEAEGYDVTPEQFFLLSKLHEQDGQSQTELADDALQDRPNLTRMVRDLESKGWIARRSDPDDGRRRIVHLTRAGQELHDGFVANVILPARSGLFAGLSDADVEATHRVFDHLESQL